MQYRRARPLVLCCHHDVCRYTSVPFYGIFLEGKGVSPRERDGREFFIILINFNQWRD